MTISVTKPSINLREKLNELDQPQGLKGTELLRADTVAEARNLIGAGRKNLIINGGFDVWQRGTSQVSATNVEQKFFADRFGIYPSGGTITADRVAFIQGQTTVPGNPNYHARIAMASGNANNWALINTKIENPERLANQTFTISFWAKGTNPGGGKFQMYESMYHNNGGSNVGAVYTDVTVTSSWQKFSFTKTEAAWNSSCVLGNNNYYYWSIIQPSADTSTNAWTLDIANIQLELGDTATDFEHRSYAEELALCQRYYERKFYTSGSMEIAHKYSSTYAVTNISYSHKRTNPTVTMPTATTTNSIANGVSLLTTAGGWASSTGTIQIQYTSSTSVRVDFLTWPSNGAVGDSTWVYFVSSSGDAYVEIDAEL